MRREDLANALAAAITDVPGVAALSPGTGVEVATYYAGGKVTGIRLSDPVDVHIVADEVPLPPIAARVEAVARAVLTGAGEDRAVRVSIDDVVGAALERRRRS